MGNEMKSSGIRAVQALVMRNCYIQNELYLRTRGREKSAGVFPRNEGSGEDLEEAQWPRPPGLSLTFRSHKRASGTSGMEQSCTI